jgi:hypothetical protein
MAIGANWAEIWGPVWEPVWTQDAAEPQPVPEPVPAQTPAGISRHRRRHYVEIDGQQFVVNSVDEARQLLEQARALAERQAEERRDVVVKKLKRKRVVPVVRIAAPVVTASPELRADLAPLIADIDRLYERAAQAAELRLLMFKQLQAEDEHVEEDLLLLL